MSATVLTSARISADSAGVRMTPEEFDEIIDYDECYRYELVHGVLVVNPIPSEAEADPNEVLGYLARFYQEQHPRGVSLDQTLPERSDSRRRADRVIWAGLGRQPDPDKDVPTIAVEFVSPGKRSWRRDYEEMREEYLALGVQEYWIIDRFERKLTVYRNQPGKSATQEITEDQTYRTGLLPGFELPLSRLLAAADRWVNR